MNNQSEEREAQVTAQMENLKDRLAELENSITGIRTRLKSVLRCDTLEDGEKAAREHEELVPLANDINASASRVNTLNIDIIAILRELEL